MSGSNRQHGNVARLDDRLAPIRTSQDEARPAGGKSENLMSGRMIVMKVVDAVAPLRRPSVAREDGLEERSWIVAGDLDRVLVEEHRKARIVRDPAVPPKNEILRRGLAGRPGSAGANGRRSCALPSPKISAIGAAS
jgi:hypothetical protein